MARVAKRFNHWEWRLDFALSLRVENLIYIDERVFREIIDYTLSLRNGLREFEGRLTLELRDIERRGYHKRFGYTTITEFCVDYLKLPKAQVRRLVKDL